MKEILIFGGTTEGRVLSEHLAASKIPHTVCVATEYGEMVLEENPFTKVHRGRMNQEQMQKFMEKGEFLAVVDATHPYADIVTKNLKAVTEERNRSGVPLPYLRLKRETDIRGVSQAGRAYPSTDIVYFNNSLECAKALEAVEGNILLTTGSKELEVFCASEKVRQRLYVRVLPGTESLESCMNRGISGKQILALQGPFTADMNEAMIRQYQIRCLVTKASGETGGYPQKLEAAKETGILTYVIGQPMGEEHPIEGERFMGEQGYSFQEICSRLELLCGQPIQQGKRLDIVLAGIGMGSRTLMTEEVCHAIKNADILLGAKRLLAEYHPRLEKRPFYQAGQIVPYLKEVQERFPMEAGRVVILFSGDSGFYSGCKPLYDALHEEVEAGRLSASLRVMPGISSVSYLASCLGESYQDAAVYSIHGRELPNLARRIKQEEKIFLLMSGAADVNKLGRLLTEAGMNECRIFAGYQLSYTEQQISLLTPEKCMEVRAEGLYTCLVKNPHPEEAVITHGLSDDVFIRGKVPMTKEEVREVSICKLGLRKDSVVYDVGSGTGSLAIEMAGLSDRIQVFAVERKKEAAALIEQNKEKFGLENITVVKAEAPEGLAELPVASHAVIGGSGGRLKEILEALYQKNPKMRVAVHAISMETISEIKEVLALFDITNEEIVQIQVNRSRQAGSYHLMQAENPVWICVFEFQKRNQK